MKHFIVKLMISLSCVLFAFSFSACRTTRGGIHVGWGSEPHAVPKKAWKGGPPAHAPAHGYRAKYTYWYYPSTCVYFDTYRKLYFYLEADNWKMAASLPEAVQLRLGSYVTMELDTGKPYTRFEEHKRKYPPGQLKKKNKNWARH
jgi:hypothetical protein